MSSFNRIARHRARRLLVQALYQWEFTRKDLTEIEIDCLADHDKEKIDSQYFHELLHAIPACLTQLDDLLHQHLDRAIVDLTPIERSILRLGSYELSKQSEIPYRVVINEAVELTKLFGANEAHKYINGVLDKLARDLRPNEIQGNRE